MRLLRLITINALLVASVNVLAQNRPPQNVRRVIVTSKYQVENGKRTSISRVIKQEIKDSLDRIHTIFYRDAETQTIVKYIWHTFSGTSKQIVRTDEFAHFKLIRYHLFSYNTDSLPTQQEVYLVKPGDTLHYVTLYYTYENGKPVKVEAKNNRGKRAYRVKSAFDDYGTEVSRKVKTYKNYFPVDSILSLTCTPTYDSLGRKISEKIVKTYIEGRSEAKRFNYEYNKKGKLSAIEEYSADGQLVFRKEYIYNSKGYLKFISVYNPDNILIDYYALRYELYPNADRVKNRIIEY